MTRWIELAQYSQARPVRPGERFGLTGGPTVRTNLDLASQQGRRGWVCTPTILIEPRPESRFFKSSRAKLPTNHSLLKPFARAVLVISFPSKSHSKVASNGFHQACTPVT